MKKLTKKNVVPFIVIIGTIIIPLLYSYFYLGAFWDPYSKLDKMPIAVMNNDKGTTLNNEEKNYGEEMCKELKEDGTFKFEFTNQQKGEKGTKNKDYYAYISIPENFSEAIASAQSNSKKMVVINYSPNEKRNYLASQILNRAILEIQCSLQNKVNSEIISQLSDRLSETPEKLGALATGLGQLNTGAATLNDGTDKLSNGTGNLATGAKTLDTGIDKLITGADKLNNSTASLPQLKSSIAELSAGASQFNSSLTLYTSGVSTLIKNVNDTSAFLQVFVKAHPELLKDPQFVGFLQNMNSDQNKKNLAILSASTSQLTAASSKISAGLKILSDKTANITQLKDGILQLKSGLEAAKKGSSALVNGASQLNTGITNVNQGTASLKDGLNKALDSVNASISNGKGEMTSLNGLNTFASSNVKVEQKNIYHVPNYGTAFAPYFLSLSMWVGALIIFFGIYLDADSRFKVLSRNSENRVTRSLCYLLISIVQALVLGVILIFILGLKVNNIPLYFAACCLTSLTFISIVQFLLVYLKDIGKFLAIALLILQLTSCGGTFPMETVPKMFNVLFPFMPMTYSVGLLKEAISGVSTHYAVYNSLVLAAIFVAFTTLTIVMSKMRVKKEEQITA